jgi:hypothetical protein
MPCGTIPTTLMNIYSLKVGMHGIHGILKPQIFKSRFFVYPVHPMYLWLILALDLPFVFKLK